VTGGSLVIEVQGGDVTITLPANASVSMDVSVISGKIQNSATTDAPSGDKLSFRMGDGKAQITIKAVNGSVNIKTS
jgi:predicted membrane protein